MTSIMLNRILVDVARQRIGKGLITFFLTDGKIINGSQWDWLNEGKGGLDIIIVVHSANRRYYVHVESIIAVGITAKAET